ncbi:MAG TPA: hypothetical protein PLH94_13850 [Fimbriimonadaceae bacterium]|nr:hypothetical protein [Fimbriimonadaceae bacterium]
MPDYVETNEAALVIQLNDHAVGMTTHGATLGFSPAEITQAATDASQTSMVVNQQSIIQSKAQEWTEFKKIVLYSPLNTPLPATPTAYTVPPPLLGALAAIVARFRQRAERAKAHPNYTQAIGEDLRIVPPAPPPPGVIKPVLSGAAETDFRVRLTFTMSGHDQLEIYSKRGAGDWELITVDTSNPYVDGRGPLVTGQPEVREYRARYKDDDLPVGEWSDVISVTAQA